MTSLDPILFRELPLIRKIIDDETWLEGERRGGAVSPNDPAVREKVCLVILRIGAQLRESLTRESLVEMPEGAVAMTSVTMLADRHVAA